MSALDEYERMMGRGGSARTSAPRASGGGYSALDEYEKMMAETRRASTTESRPRPGRATAYDVQSARARTDTAGGFVYGVADTVTFGYLDEAGALLDWAVMGKDYESSLKRNRELISGVREDHSVAYLGGQLAGAFVPFFGMGGRIANSARFGNLLKGTRGYLVTGAAQGALYGAGSADGGFYDRVQGAAWGGAIGAAGGYVLGAAVIPAAKFLGREGRDLAGKAAIVIRRGKEPRLTTKVTPRATEPAPTPAAGRAAAEAVEAPRLNAITGEADDVLEDGALLSMRELLGDPGAARRALEKRLGKLTAVEAQRIAQRLENAELGGNVIDDPQYRSLLGIDLSDTKIDTDTAMLAVELLEEATTKIVAKAGAGTRTFGSMDAQVRAKLQEGVMMGDLEEALKRSREGIADTRIAKHAMMLAGVQFVRAKDKFLPLIQQGVEGARNELVEALTKSAHLYAMSKGIVSNAGRTLGYLRENSKLAFEDVADDLIEVESIDSLRKRVDGALKELGDDDLRDLLGRLRTTADIDKIEEILTSAEAAKDFSGWRRTMNSVSTFLRSNALTPATGLFNTISFIGHDLFRNNLVKRWAARGFEKAGKADEAMALRFEREAASRVYWEAHRRGLKAMTSRIKWEFWSDVERIAAVGWGDGSVTAGVRARKAQMLTEGYRAPELREFQQQPRLAVTNPATFNERLENVQGGAFGNLVYHAERAGAVAANTLDAAGNASMKLFTGAIDDWGREFIKVKETYAMSARYAIREALDQQLPQEELLAYAAKRAQELAELPPSEIMAEVEVRLLQHGELDEQTTFYMQRERDVELEAERTLFLDGPQTSGGKASADFASLIDRLAGLNQVQGIILPYIRTPIRLFERGLVSYTPWGRASKEVQDALTRGGMEAELVKAQMEVGFMGIMLGAALGAGGGLTLSNGGWNNSANLDAGPPNRVNFPGGGYVEIGRLDPFSLTLALGGFVGQALREGWHDAEAFDVQTGVNSALQIAFLAVRDSVLEKSYLKGLKEVMEVLFNPDAGAAGERVDRVLQGAFTRLIPVSGISRQINDTLRGDAPDAVGWVDNMLRAIPGGGLYLAPRVDALGDSVDGRVMGVSVGDSSTTPVKEQLRDLGIDIKTLRRSDPAGFNLTSDELSELLTIRGKEAVNEQGMTMSEALEDLFADPFFQGLPDKDQKRRMVVDLMAEFNEPARAILEERDPQYLSNRQAHKSLSDYIAEGLSRDQAEREVRVEAEDSGLPPPNL